MENTGNTAIAYRRQIQNPHTVLSACASSLLLLAIMALPTGQAQAAASSLRITELMPNTRPDATDWIEIHNPGSKAVDLKGCELTNAKSQTFRIDTPARLEAGEYGILSGDAADTSLPSALAHFSAVEFQLDAAGGSVSLHCEGRKLDSASWNNYLPGPASPSRSLHLDPDLLGDDAGTLAAQITEPWCYTLLLDDNVYAEGKIGTPAKSNGYCPNRRLPHRYVDNQAAVAIDGIDFATTMKIARAELAERTVTSELTIWALRDQTISADIAKEISELYFQYIDGLYDVEPMTILDWNHAVWHFAWAVANLYRNGDAEVKSALQSAYDDALKRPDSLQKYRYIAIDHIHGERVTMGDMHDRARAYARRHIVVPGNSDFIQNYEEYLDKKPGPVTIAAVNYWYRVKTWFVGLTDGG